MSILTSKEKAQIRAAAVKNVREVVTSASKLIPNKVRKDGSN